MIYGYSMIGINPPFPTLPVGFASATRKLSLVKGDLFAQCFYLEDNETKLCFITLDSLGVSHDIQSAFEQIVHNVLGYDVTLILSSTHTHYAPSLANAMGFVFADTDYVRFVCDRLHIMLSKLKLREHPLIITHHTSTNSEIGRSRLSHLGDEFVTLSVISFYHQNTRLGHWVVYNCHPTILPEDSLYLSSDYIGVFIEEMKRSYPNEFTMFFQGAAGDISTRFTRKEKSYEEVIRMGRLLKKAVDTVLESSLKKSELRLTYKHHSIPLSHQFKSIQSLSIPEGISDKEKREFEQGAKMIENIANHPEHLLPEASIEEVCFGPVTLFFQPFELFSSYLKYTNKQKIIIGYSQGIGSYVTELQPKFPSYESLMETISSANKKQLIQIFKPSSTRRKADTQ